VFGCALSLPRIVSGDGVGRSIGIALDEDEHARLEASASLLRAQAAELT
jgi:malate/lactate dehydrogenase